MIRGCVMNKNIAQFIKDEMILMKYYEYSEILLMSITIICLIICAGLIGFQRESITWKKYFLDILEIIVQNIIIVLAGNMLNGIFTKEILSISNTMPLQIFIITVAAIVMIQIIEMIRYRITWFQIIKQSCDILTYCIFAIVALLSVMKHLELIELIACISILWMFQLIKTLIADQSWDTLKIKRKVSDDLPVDREEQLFESRKIQLKYFYEEMKEIKEDPFAVMISGPWGYGKTSFINGFMYKMTHGETVEGEFVLVEAGFDYNVVGMLSDIAVQLERIFSRNNIYIGKGSAVDKYFSGIIDMLKETEMSAGAVLLEWMKKEQQSYYQKNKKLLNMELKRLWKKRGKRVYIIIDNLDRIQEEARDKMFEVIRESVTLNNCTTIFLADYENFKTKQLNREFLEKYINRHVVLCKISFKEIYNYYRKNFLPNSITDGMNDAVKEIGEKIKEILPIEMDKEENEVKKIINDFKEELKACDKGLVDSVYNVSAAEQLAQKMEREFIGLNERMENPRKTKRFLFDCIQMKLKLLDKVLISDKNNVELTEKLNNNQIVDIWSSLIVRVSFLQCFFVEEFAFLMCVKSIEEFRERYKNKNEYKLIEIVLGKNIFYTKDTIEAANCILYQLM